MRLGSGIHHASVTGDVVVASPVPAVLASGGCQWHFHELVAEKDLQNGWFQTCGSKALI